MEFTDKEIGKVTIQVKISEDDLSCLMDTALSGGINHWAGVDLRGVKNPDNDAISEVLTKRLIEGKTLILYDLESSTEWILTLERILQGLQKQLDNDPDPDPDNWDVDFVDNVFQYAVFNELIYC